MSEIELYVLQIIFEYSAEESVAQYDCFSNIYTKKELQKTCKSLRKQDLIRLVPCFRDNQIMQGDLLGSGWLITKKGIQWLYDNDSDSMNDYNIFLNDFY